MSLVDLHGAGERPDLLEAFGRREPGAVRAMYRGYGRLAYAVAHQVLGRRDLAEAAVRRTFVEASRSAQGISRERDPAPWMASIAYRAAVAIQESAGGGQRG